jgi:hypothetical protein
MAPGTIRSIISSSMKYNCLTDLCPIPTSSHFSVPVSYSPFPRYFLVPEHFWCQHFSSSRAFLVSAIFWCQRHLNGSARKIVFTFVPLTTTCRLPRLPATSMTTCCLSRLPAASHGYPLPPTTTCCQPLVPSPSLRLLRERPETLALDCFYGVMTAQKAR